MKATLTLKCGISRDAESKMYNNNSGGLDHMETQRPLRKLEDVFERFFNYKVWGIKRCEIKNAYKECTIILEVIMSLINVILSKTTMLHFRLLLLI